MKVCIYMGREDWEKIKREAKAEGMSASAFLIKCYKQVRKAWEDVELSSETKQALNTLINELRE